jgi:glycosyltransferase involved in cell wall biosynthesis
MLSVIVPVRDGARDLERLLPGLFRTRLPRFEVIVVDDASTDDTAAVCARFPARRVVLPRQAGPARARNVGACESRGEILVFVDCDVALPPEGDLLARLCETLERRPEVDSVLTISDVVPVEESAVAYNASVYHAYYMERFLGAARERQGRLMFFTTRLGAMRASSFRRSGGFHESLTTVMNEDGEFGARCHALGFVSYVSAGLVHAHRYPRGWARFARSYFLTALVQALIESRHDVSPDESVSPAERARRLYAAALLVSPAALAFMDARAYAAALLTALIGFAASFGRMNALVWTRVPWRHRAGWYLVYVAVTPVILAGYARGVWLGLRGTRLLAGRPSDLPLFGQGGAAAR